MEKRYQVFVSSTFLDLQDERREVMQALLELDCIPAGMELFPASNEAQFELIKKVIDDCDYYLLIVGGRYGNMTAAGVSYTEMEFDYAAANSKPILAFVHADPDQITKGKSESDPAAIKKLDEFRMKVKTGRMIRQWTTAEELGSVVSRSVIKAIKTTPTEGWVKGRYAATTELLEQLNTLREANDKLRADIKRAKNSPPEGTSQYQGGDERLKLSGSVRIGERYPYRALVWSAEASWDEIFHEVGPELFGECPESKMATDIATSFFRRDDKLAQVVDVQRADLNMESLQSIKVQLFALGLIQRGSKQRGVQDSQTYWRLTSYGEDYLMKLRALKKD